MADLPAPGEPTFGPLGNPPAGSDPLDPSTLQSEVDGSGAMPDADAQALLNAITGGLADGDAGSSGVDMGGADIGGADMGGADMGRAGMGGGGTNGADMDSAAIEELLNQANFEDPTSLSSTTPETPDSGESFEMPVPDAESFKLPSFQQVMQDAQVSSIDLLRDVELNVKIELGRSRMLVEDVLKLGEGSVVELDKLAGDPVDVFVNDRLVARGEVLVLNDNFCVRVNEIVAGAKEEGL